MHTHPSPSAHVCTPAARRTSRPAAPRNKARPRQPKLLFPALPTYQERTDAEFWRAAFLRDLCLLAAGKALANKAYRSTSKTGAITAHFIGNGVTSQYQELKTSFHYWVEAMGGLVASPVEQQQRGVA